MQQQHVQTTIRPLVCDLLTTRRALEKLEAKKIMVTHLASGEKPGTDFTVKNAEVVFFETIGQLISL